MILIIRLGPGLSFWKSGNQTGSSFSFDLLCEFQDDGFRWHRCPWQDQETAMQADMKAWSAGGCTARWLVYWMQGSWGARLVGCWISCATGNHRDRWEKKWPRVLHSHNAGPCFDRKHRAIRKTRLFSARFGTDVSRSFSSSFIFQGHI